LGLIAVFDSLDMEQKRAIMEPGPAPSGVLVAASPVGRGGADAVAQPHVASPPAAIADTDVSPQVQHQRQVEVASATCRKYLFIAITLVKTYVYGVFGLGLILVLTFPKTVARIVLMPLRYSVEYTKLLVFTVGSQLAVEFWAALGFSYIVVSPEASAGGHVLHSQCPAPTQHFTDPIMGPSTYTADTMPSILPTVIGIIIMAWWGGNQQGAAAAAPA
jgi:hypothetical protein